MVKIIHKVPFLRVTAALAAGIITGSCFQLNHYFLCGAGLSFLSLLLLLNARYRYRFSVYFGFLVCLVFFCAGIIIYQVYNKKPEFCEEGKFIASVLDILQEKPNTFQSSLRIHAVVEDGAVIPAKEKVLVWFEKDSTTKALVPGTTIAFKKVPEFIKGTGNPFDFNYKLYQARKKVFRQVYLPSGAWVLCSPVAKVSLPVKAEQARMQLLKIFASQRWDEDKEGIISALVLGYKQGLDDQTKRTFTSAGTVHLLAVSGLHVGIWYFTLAFIFGFLKNQQNGNILFIILIVLLLWTFAFITGLSPSVKRAATMFSFIVIGQNLKKQINIYNIIIASAFFLLLFNPNNLFDAGFQLSYSAVFGIVFVQPKLEKLAEMKNKIYRYLWTLFTVSIAAQIATFPISAYYFHQFPVYFWLSNMVAVPVVTVVVPFGLALLVLNWIPFLSDFISGTINMCLNFLIGFLQWIESLPMSVIDIPFTALEMVFMIAVFFTVVILIESQQKIHLRNSLIYLFLFLITSLLLNIHSFYRKEIIIYDNPGQYIVHVVAGKRNYIISEEFLQLDNPVHNLTRNTIRAFRLRHPVYLTGNNCFNDSVICLNRGLLKTGNLLICLSQKNLNEENSAIPDIVVGNPDSFRKNGIINSETIIVVRFHADNQEGLTIHNLNEKGAFRKKW